MVKSVVLAWGSLVWDPRELQTAAKFTANGPLLPIEFCRISADGRLTLAIDETFGALCKTYSAPSALESLDAARDDLCLQGGNGGCARNRLCRTRFRQTKRLCDGKPSTGRRARSAPGPSRSATTPRSGLRSPATSTSGARAASRSPSPRRCNISKRWKVTTPPSSRRRSPISGKRRPRSRRRCATRSPSAGLRRRLGRQPTTGVWAISRTTAMINAELGTPQFRQLSLD